MESTTRKDIGTLRTIRVKTSGRRMRSAKEKEIEADNKRNYGE
jgi:hypothetical protein